MAQLTLHMIAAATDVKAISEQDFQKAICAYAEGQGWLVHYQRRSGFVGTDGKWRGSGPKGFPDVVLARHGRPLFLELKAHKGKLRDDQVAWSEELGERYWRLWRPADARAVIDELE